MKHRHKGPKVIVRREDKVFRRKRPKHKISKRYVVYKRPPSKLSKEHRSIFQGLDKKPYETGGYMDFNLKGLERADVYIGRPGSVDIPTDADSEIDWHTHPKSNGKIGRIDAFPSFDDVTDFKYFPSQSMLVLHNGKIMMGTKTPKFKVNKTSLKEIDKGIVKDSEKMDVPKLFKKYKPLYEQMGLKMEYIDHKGPIRIPIDIVEPKHKSKLRKGGWLFGDDPIERGYTKEGQFLFGDRD